MTNKTTVIDVIFNSANYIEIIYTRDGVTHTLDLEYDDANEFLESIEDNPDNLNTNCLIAIQNEYIYS